MRNGAEVPSLILCSGCRKSASVSGGRGETQRQSFGQKRKNSLIALPGKGGSQQADAFKTVCFPSPRPAPWERIDDDFTVWEWKLRSLRRNWVHASVHSSPKLVFRGSQKCSDDLSFGMKKASLTSCIWEFPSWRGGNESD